jgi:hypothetical protein
MAATTRPTLTMRTGAFAMIDALGVRGIWQRFSESDVIASLEQIAAMTLEQTRAIQDAGGGESFSVLESITPAFLSDPIVFGVATKPLEEVNRVRTERAPFPQFRDQLNERTLAARAVEHAAHVVSTVLRRGVMQAVPLSFRGALAYGRFAMSDRFILGPAVDEAAVFHELAHGAMVGLTPSAFEVFSRGDDQSPSVASPLMPYRIPTKNEPGRWETCAVVPFLPADGDDAGRRGFFDEVIATFVTASTSTRSLIDDVEQKKRNTVAFLRAVEKDRTDLRDSGAWKPKG